MEDEHKEEKRYCGCGTEMDDEDFEKCESCNYEENQNLYMNNEDLNANELFDESWE